MRFGKCVVMRIKFYGLQLTKNAQTLLFSIRKQTMRKLRSVPTLCADRFAALNDGAALQNGDAAQDNVQLVCRNVILVLELRLDHRHHLAEASPFLPWPKAAKPRWGGKSSAIGLAARPPFPGASP